MDPAKLKAILEALKNEDGDAALKLLEELIAELAGAGSGAPPPAASESASAGNAETPPDEMTALGRELVSLSSSPNPGAALEFYKGLVERFKKADLDRQALETSQRKDFVTRLVKCGAETPATAFELVNGEVPEKDAKIVARLSSEPIEAMRKRVEALEAANGRNRPVIKKPIVTETGAENGGQVVKTSRGEILLSAREIKNCEEQGVKVEAYAENKSIRESARSHK